MAAEVVWPGEAFPAHRADVGLVHAAVVGAGVVRHAVLPLEALVADGTLEGLLVRVGQLVAIEVVDVTEGLAAHLAAMVLLHGLGGLLVGHVALRHVAHGGRRHDAGARGDRGGGGRGGEEARHGGDVGGVGLGVGVWVWVVVWVWVGVGVGRGTLPDHAAHGRHHGHHGGRRLRRLLGARHHLDARVARLVAAQVVAVAEGLVAVATDEGRLAALLLLHHRHGPVSAATAAGHVVLEELGGANRRLPVHLDGQDGLLVDGLGPGVEQRQQAVLGHLVLVMEGFIGLLQTQGDTGRGGLEETALAYRMTIRYQE